MFDGMYENTVIRNNLVSVNAYHGLTIAGSRNGLITQNTVVNASGIVGPHPWIKVAYHKNGTPPSNTMVANNTAMSVKLPTDTSLNVKMASNTLVTNFTTEFVSPSTRNYALQATAKSANAASTQYMTPADIAGTARPKGKGPDAGAYESQ
jgi:parallel beta-helix repeat protein